MKEELFKVDVTYPVDSPCESIAKEIIEINLAICAQITPNITSIYSWNGTVTSDKEQTISFKCLKNQHPHLLTHIKNNRH